MNLPDKLTTEEIEKYRMVIKTITDGTWEEQREVWNNIRWIREQKVKEALIKAQKKAYEDHHGCGVAQDVWKELGYDAKELGLSE